MADRDLWSSHEARAAQDAQSILLNQQWGLPRLFDKKVELQKPPLYYWLVAAIAVTRGQAVDAWAVRLPAAVGGLAGVLLLYGLGLRRGRKLAGFVAAGMMATALHYTWLARVGRIDMLLCLTSSLALLGFFLGQRCWHERQGRTWHWFALFYVACALAVLLKGPIGLILPTGVAVACLFTEGDLCGSPQISHWLRLGHRLGLWWGVPLLACLVLPWYVWANERTNGELFQVFFWKHNLERGLGGGTLKAHPWWFYGPQLALDWLPWSLLVPVLLWVFIKRNWWRNDPEARFGIVWLVVMLVILSCARFKRSDYLLPAYPGLALLLGSIAERVYAAASARKLLFTGFVSALAAAAVGWCIYVDEVLPRQESHLEFRRFAEEIRRRVPSPGMVIFFRAEAHALAFHVGPPIDTILEWENLDVWASRPETWYVVMPPENAAEWRRYLKSGQLEEVLRDTDLAGGEHTHPLVLMRTRPGAGPPSDP